MGQQPSVDHGRLVGGQAVADHVDRQAGLSLPVDLIDRGRRHTIRANRVKSGP